MESLPSKIVVKSSTSASSSQVWMAIQVWHDKPHVINRRVTGAMPVLTSKLDKSVTLNELYKLFIDTKITKFMTDDEIKQIFSSMDIYKKDEDEDDFGLCLTLRKLIPRNNRYDASFLEITVLDEVNCKATFFSLHQDQKQDIVILKTPYTFQFVEGEIQLIAHADELDENAIISWLMKSVFPKIQKWAEVAVDQNIPSLSLVSVDRYTLLYQNLKKKYGQQMVEIWPENTNPSKFVYEDVAIAAYLLLLWEKQREEQGQPDWKQTFVDLGCGNGLLVHILACEGHKGFGIDVRKRGIWDLYPSTTVLKVQTITPSDDFLFPEADWVIGNHSDELTPWIPVIAARSSYNCCFFVIPCCCFDFNGYKYQRLSTSQSMYSEYLDYVEHVSEVCGFETQRDKLRIPSTKRICIVGSKRNHTNEEVTTVQKNITALINKCCSREKRSRPISESEQGIWVEEFKPRQKEESVRNCTQLDHGIVNSVIDTVASLILKDYKKAEGPTSTWNAGVAISLGEVAAGIPKELLKEMKNECGGLQTLLRNNHQIFLIEGGKVKFRTPISIGETTTKNIKLKRNKKIKIKVKPCWFFQNHPDGCPLSDSECSFLH